MIQHTQDTTHSAEVGGEQEAACVGEHQASILSMLDASNACASGEQLHRVASQLRCITTYQVLAPPALPPAGSAVQVVLVRLYQYYLYSATSCSWPQAYPACQDQPLRRAVG